jgi:hypothetical protein
MEPSLTRDQDKDGDKAAKRSEDLSMQAWQKAFDTFAEDLELQDLSKWVFRLIGEVQNPSDSLSKDLVKKRLITWMQGIDAGTCLSACRSQMGAFPQSDLAQKQLEHRLILLLAIHALMQTRNLVVPNTQLVCPESAAQVQDYEVAIAIVAHLYYGQGCVLELRGGQWRVANMIRTDALEPMEAKTDSNGNIEQIKLEVESHIKRARPSLFPSTSDMKRFKSDHGGVPFVLDVQKVLDAQACAALSQQLNLKVIPVGADDAQQIEFVMDQVRSQLQVLFSTSHHVHQTKKEDTMQANSVKLEIKNTGTGTINLGAASIGNNNQQEATQTINNSQPEKLTEFVEAMQAIHGMLNDSSKKQEIEGVIEIVQNKEDNPTAQRSLKRMMDWLKGGAENTVLVTDTIEALDKVKTHAAVAAAALLQYWPMV